jgi:hypothetical protein
MMAKITVSAAQLRFLYSFECPDCHRGQEISLDHLVTDAEAHDRPCWYCGAILRVIIQQDPPVDQIIVD